MPTQLNEKQRILAQLTVTQIFLRHTTGKTQGEVGVLLPIEKNEEIEEVVQFLNFASSTFGCKFFFNDERGKIALEADLCLNNKDLLTAVNKALESPSEIKKDDVLERLKRFTQSDVEKWRASTTISGAINQSKAA